MLGDTCGDLTWDDLEKLGKQFCSVLGVRSLLLSLPTSPEVMAACNNEQRAIVLARNVQQIF